MALFATSKKWKSYPSRSSVHHQSDRKNLEMEEKRREREVPDDVNEKEMDVIEESDDINEMEALLPPIKCENNDLASSSTDQHEQHQPKDSIIDIKELEKLMEFLGDHVNYNLKDIHETDKLEVPFYLQHHLKLDWIIYFNEDKKNLNLDQNYGMNK
ncbi:hypothetical protein Q3G72_014724 [Acer saccharum]|nr:hypothetical protein Q3G72_014724 [Acer saccharum]